MKKSSSLLLCFAFATACASTQNPDDAMLLPDGGNEPQARCMLTPPRPSDAAEAKALAAAPAQCGQPAYAWLDSQKLGDFVAAGASEAVAAASSQILLAAGKVTPPGPVHDVNVEQISYTTQDRGKLLFASALIAYPTDLDASAGKPPTLDVLLVLHGTSGFTDQCAPSSDSSSYGLAAALASLGYVVIAPDYIGLLGLGGKTGFLHPYLVGQPTAIASLDAVRAAAKYLAIGKSGVAICAGTRFATIGGSQGGHAALWVDRLAPYYAPELTHLGVVATVPPADLLGEGVRALSTLVPASANLAAFFASSSDWYGLRNRLNEVFVSPLDKDLPAALETSCDPSDKLKAKGLSDVFTQAVLDAAMTADGVRKLMPWGCLAVENGLTTTSIKRLPPQAPGYGVMYLLGESDTLVNPPIERASFTTLCNQGMKLQYLECAGASHTQATQWALPEIVDFLSDRFAGKAPDAALSCKLTAAVRCRATP